MRAAPLVLLIATACPVGTPEERPPVELSLQIATRQSCGILSGLDYDTSCLRAVHVRVLDELRRQLDQYCVPLDPPPTELRELLRGEAILRFSRLSTNRTVSFEVRGLHGAGGVDVEDLCAGAASARYWLFWGESPLVDLTTYDGDAGNRLITIFVDCRDCECDGEDCFGCAGIRADTCPAEMPTAFCVPTSSCDKACQRDDDCFNGARRCIDGRCDVATINGGLCSPCNAVAGCGDRLSCVGRVGGPSFCAPACPDAFCTTGTKCNRLGNNLERR
jgi:hypothetical protein